MSIYRSHLRPMMPIFNPEKITGEITVGNTPPGPVDDMCLASSPALVVDWREEGTVPSGWYSAGDVMFDGNGFGSGDGGYVGLSTYDSFPSPSAATLALLVWNIGATGSEAGGQLYPDPDPDAILYVAAMAAAVGVTYYGGNYIGDFVTLPIPFSGLFVVRENSTAISLRVYDLAGDLVASSVTAADNRAGEFTHHVHVVGDDVRMSKSGFWRCHLSDEECDILGSTWLHLM